MKYAVFARFFSTVFTYVIDISPMETISFWVGIVPQWRKLNGT
jgi:hypothetical protein